MNNKCLKCGFELNGNVPFCPNCGNKIEQNVSGSTKKFCLYCGKQIDANVKFCPECGANFENGSSGNYSNNGQVNYQGVDDSSVNTAFVFSLVGLLCCAIFSIPGLIKANDCLAGIDAGRISPSKRGLANAAKVISIIGLVLWILGIFLNYYIKRG